MSNKFARLLVKDPQVKLLLVLLALAIAATVLLVKKSQKQVKELADLQSKKTLVTMLPKMEARVRSEELKVKEGMAKVEAKESKLVLSGIFVEKEKKIAIINGIICREGDSIENYIVLTITIRSVILKKATSNKILQLTL